MKVADLVYENISPLFSNDIKLVEVEYVKKNDGMHLVILIDKQDGITIDDCVFVNDLISDKLDELDPTKDQPYFLDVSSYGLDRPLKYDWQFKKYQNQLVDVKLYHKVEDKKQFTAKLISFDEVKFQFEIDNEIFTINKTDIANITPYIDF